jgi:hypothetical protein
LPQIPGFLLEGTQFKIGQTLHLAAGLAEVVFGCGAKIIVQGPADMEIDSAKAATLHIGRLTADVPDDLEGFKIHTAVAEIHSLPVALEQPVKPEQHAQPKQPRQSQPEQQAKKALPATM